MSIVDAKFGLTEMIMSFLETLEHDLTSLSFFSKYSLCIDHRKVSIKEETFSDEDGWFYFDDEDDKYVLVRMDYLVTESIWEGLWLPNTKNIKMIAEMFEIAEIIDKPTPHI